MRLSQSVLPLSPKKKKLEHSTTSMSSSSSSSSSRDLVLSMVEHPPRPTSRMGFLDDGDDDGDDEPSTSNSCNLDNIMDASFTDEDHDSEDDGQTFHLDESDSESCFPLPPSASPSTFLGYHIKHHGPSRRHLMHLKWFWAAREEEWEMSRAYDGLSQFSSSSPRSNAVNRPYPRRPALRPVRSPPSSPCLPSSSTTTTTSTAGARDPQTLPPLTVHPRLGDLSSLRDPYCAHVDRCFVSLPLWTITKTLYMADLHVACIRATPHRSSPRSNETTQASTPSLSHASSFSDIKGKNTVFHDHYHTLDDDDGMTGEYSSDDSDATLVDDASEDEVSPVDETSGMDWDGITPRRSQSESEEEEGVEEWERWDVVDLTDGGGGDDGSTDVDSGPSSAATSPESPTHISAYIAEQHKTVPIDCNSSTRSKLVQPTAHRQQTLCEFLDASATKSASSFFSSSRKSRKPSKFDSDSDSIDEEEDSYQQQQHLLDVWRTDWYRKWEILIRIASATTSCEKKKHGAPSELDFILSSPSFVALQAMQA